VPTRSRLSNRQYLRSKRSTGKGPRAKRVCGRPADIDTGPQHRAGYRKQLSGSSPKSRIRLSPLFDPIAHDLNGETQVPDLAMVVSMIGLCEHPVGYRAR
jgi:hypothetical protein